MAKAQWLRGLIERGETTIDPANDGPVAVYERDIRELWSAAITAKSYRERKEAELREALLNEDACNQQLADYMNAAELRFRIKTPKADADEWTANITGEA